MTEVSKCLSCLETNALNHDKLCEACALHNESLDGTLLALLTAEAS